MYCTVHVDVSSGSIAASFARPRRTVINLRAMAKLSASVLLLLSAGTHAFQQINLAQRVGGFQQSPAVAQSQKRWLDPAMAEEVEELGKDGRRKWKGFYANKGLVQREKFGQVVFALVLIANVAIFSLPTDIRRARICETGFTPAGVQCTTPAEFRKMISEHYATCGKDGATECVKFDFSRE